MRELREIIYRHKEKYPDMKPQDVVKLIYQNEFGPGHFVENEHVALQRLVKEYNEATFGGKDSPIEPIGNGLCRYYLWGVRRSEIEMLNRIFVLTANSKKGNIESFEEKLLQVYDLFPQADFDFTQKEYAAYIKEQKEKGYPAVSHSEHYREVYHPCYRVVNIRYAPFLEIFSILEEKRKCNPKLVVGIDGNAAAGKTTLADCLAVLFDCEVIHMDDFFLPQELRTAERLADVGGNIHYERFREEVVRGIQSRKEFAYRVFSCHDMNYTEEKRIGGRKMIVVEGVYSMRKDFRDIYNCKIFMKISDEKQRERIIERNGEEMYRVFGQKWIPMENRYFKECNIEAASDYVFQY